MVTTARDATAENHSMVRVDIRLSLSPPPGADELLPLPSPAAPLPLAAPQDCNACVAWPTRAVVMKWNAVRVVGNRKRCHDMTALFTMINPTDEHTFILHAPALDSEAGSLSMAPAYCKTEYPSSQGSQ